VTPNHKKGRVLVRRGHTYFASGWERIYKGRKDHFYGRHNTQVANKGHFGKKTFNFLEKSRIFIC